MYDYPKLREPVIFLILAALAVSIAWKARDLPDWVRLFVVLLAIVFGAAGVATMFDWLSHNMAQRLREINTARTWGAVNLANAFRGLTAAQTESVLAGEKVGMLLIPSDDEPMLFVRGLTRSIPWDTVEEFLQLSVQTEPFLYPVREFGNEAFATDLTNLIVSRGWANAATGPYSAKLTKPLEWVAQRFWVEIEKEPEEDVVK